jgi:hypothetical protein
MFCEDTILANHLIQQGESIQFVPEIKVFHINRKGYSSFKNALQRSGYYSGIARKLFALKGSIFAKLPILIPLLIPYRCFNIYRVNCRKGNPYRKKIFKLFPLVFWGILIWTVAFWNGVGAVRNGKNVKSK